MTARILDFPGSRRPDAGAGAGDADPTGDPLLAAPRPGPRETTPLVGRRARPDASSDDSDTGRPKREHITRKERRELERALFDEETAEQIRAARGRHPTAHRVDDGPIDPWLARTAAIGEPTLRRPPLPRGAIGRTLWPVLLAAVMIGMLFTFVFPTRTLLAQREILSSAKHDLDDLQTENAELEARIAALGTDAELERLARQELNMVRPNEIAYTILPPAALTTLPDGVPFDLLRAWLTAP